MNWLDSYLSQHEDLRGARVAAWAADATHFVLAPGLRRAVITGGPQYLRGSRGWLPLDTQLQADGAGEFGAGGLPARIAPDGTVRLPAQHYAHRTRSAGWLQRGAYAPLARFDAGQAAGNCLARRAGVFEHRICITPRGVKEELIVLAPPAMQAGALVYETELDAAPLRAASDGTLHAGGLRLPPGSARDANGVPLPVERVLLEDGRARLYTGVPAHALAGAVYPVTIDPAVIFGGSTADGSVWGQSSAYSTARNTSSGLDITATQFDIGQTLSAGTYYVYRGFLKFSLASIPLQAELFSATLGLVCTADLSNTADFDVQVVAQDWSAQDPLAAGTREAAYDACLAGATDAVWHATSTLSTGVQVQSAPLSLAGMAPGGVAYLSLRSSRDKTGATPTGSERVQIASAEHATPGFRPVLVVDYYAVAPATGHGAQPLPAIRVRDTRIKLRARRRGVRLPAGLRRS
jgi:hypothetical protein